jgi:hypothetical protein
MAWRTRKNGRHYQKYPRRGLFANKPVSKKYSEILSEIHEPSDANTAAKEMEQEFKQHKTREAKVHVKKAMVQRANRASVASHNKILSPEVRAKEARIARIFYASEKRMVLDPPVSKREIRAERAMVQDESEGYAKYEAMAKQADKEDRHEDAKVFRQHAADELRHKREDQEILIHPDNVKKNLNSPR